MRGRAYVFGDNIDTDQIYPGRYLHLVKPEEIKEHVLENADPTFSRRFQPGGIVVAGRNFGCGSSREHAAITLKEAGVAAVLAESFGRIFFRNAINLGLPLMIVKGIRDKVKEGDEIEVDLESGVVTLPDGCKIQGEPLSPYILNLIRHGGIKNLYKSGYRPKPE